MLVRVVDHSGPTYTTHVCCNTFLLKCLSMIMMQHLFILTLHSHPTSDNPPSRYCQREKKGVCSYYFHYPQRLQDTTTINFTGKVHYQHRKAGDEMVVPYCLPLLHMYQCHINFEVASAAHLFQYMFKYIHKGTFPSLLSAPAFTFPFRT